MTSVARNAAVALAERLRTSPAVLVHGPRQCGKTTLVRTVLAAWTHLDLERPRDLALLSADLEGFLEAHPRRLVVDEAQRLPALFPALRHALDAHGRKGAVVLLGSASPALLRTAGESLAGRVSMLELTPLLARELAGHRGARDRWMWGGFPPALAQRGDTARRRWLEDYLSAVLERDLPALGIGLPAVRLRMLLTMLVHVHGNLLNQSDLARSLAVSVPTVARDLDVLEGVGLLRRLYPFHANVQKRLTKTPKVFVRDTGILHSLAGLRGAADLATWSRRGASFEGLVVEELIALARERCVRPEAYFWRTEAGGEVDLLLVDGPRIVPIEIKAGAAVAPGSVRGLRACMSDLGLDQGFVVTLGGERTRLGRDLEVVPWADVAAGGVDFGLGRRR